MDVDALLYHYLTDGLNRNQKNHVGMELEFPIIAIGGARTELHTVKALFEALSAIGYHISKVSTQGIPIAARDEAGNVATFDTCYENFEYAAASAPSMTDIYLRFRETLALTQTTLEKEGRQLVGIGYNPMMEHHKPHMLENELTLAIGSLIHDQHGTASVYSKDFYCGVSSEQVHFNATEQTLPLVFELFTRLDFMNILLFADSPAHLRGGQYICARNELYMRSPLRQLDLVGAQPLGCESAKDIARAYHSLKLFIRRREGKLELFPPVNVCDYFENESYGALAEDIEHLDLERNIVTTSYGTIEYRMLCTQPFTDAFSPSAFCLGLHAKLSEALELSRAFDACHSMPEPNARNRMASLGEHPFATEADILQYAQQLLALSESGLKARGYGEEIFLTPLKARAHLLDAPAKRFIRETAQTSLHDALRARARIGDPLIGQR